MLDPSLYSIISTAITFFILMSYYLMKTPDFVTTIDKNEKVFSLRLAIVYSLLFSSAIGLLVLGIFMIEKYRQTHL